MTAELGHTPPPARDLRGLEKICKIFGRLQCGDTMMAWDYAIGKAVPESEMPAGSERWQKSERARWEKHAPTRSNAPVF